MFWIRFIYFCNQFSFIKPISIRKIIQNGKFKRESFPVGPSNFPAVTSKGCKQLYRVEAPLHLNCWWSQHLQPSEVKARSKSKTMKTSKICLWVLLPSTLIGCKDKELYWVHVSQTDAATSNIEQLAGTTNGSKDERNKICCREADYSPWPALFCCLWTPGLLRKRWNRKIHK